MKTIVVAGGTGMVGSQLIPMLEKEGWQVKILTRNKQKSKNGAKYILWDLESGFIGEGYSEADVVINLAGEGIADGKWSEERKKSIINSRIKSTQLLISAAEKNSKKLQAYISASAIGYYGDGGDKLLKEDTGVVTEEFLSDVCVLWEEEAKKAQAICPQVSIVRIGTVLSSEGGALEKMDATIPFGVANYLGSGNQYMSWIHIDDLCGIIIHLIKEQLAGTFNAVAPTTYRNKEFTRILKNTINKHAVLLPAPAFGIKMIFGEMARVVLNSSKVSAEKLISSGYQFVFPELEKALHDIYNQ